MVKEYAWLVGHDVGHNCRNKHDYRKSLFTDGIRISLEPWFTENPRNRVSTSHMYPNAISYRGKTYEQVIGEHHVLDRKGEIYIMYKAQKPFGWVAPDDAIEENVAPLCRK